MQLEKNKKQSLKTFFSLLVLLVLLGFVGAIYQAQENPNNKNIKIQKRYDNKIVYTTDIDNADKEKLKKDCESRNGTFNTCGNICAPDAEMCSQICAYTCNLTPSVKDKAATSTPRRENLQINNLNKTETNSSSTNNKKINNSKIEIYKPVSSKVVKSPLEIKGKARGGWFFEEAFQAVLKDANSKTIGTAQVKAQGEWTTNDFIPFKTTISFEEPNTKQGVLMLKKPNPSGLPENEEIRAIPLNFK